MNPNQKGGIMTVSKVSEQRPTYCPSGHYYCTLMRSISAARRERRINVALFGGALVIAMIGFILLSRIVVNW